MLNSRICMLDNYKYKDDIQQEKAIKQTVVKQCRIQVDNRSISTMIIHPSHVETHFDPLVNNLKTGYIV